jgi:hypothetical protein
MPQGIGKVGSKSPDAIGAFLLPQERGIMPRQRARHCDNYSPGHTPHFIQARKAGEGEWLKAKVTYLGSDLFELNLEDGRVLTRRNHEPGRLLSHLDAYGQWPVRFQERYFILGIESGPGITSMFSMSRQPLEACLDEYAEDLD